MESPNEHLASSQSVMPDGQKPKKRKNPAFDAAFAVSFWFLVPVVLLGFVAGGNSSSGGFGPFEVILFAPVYFIALFIVNLVCYYPVTWILRFMKANISPKIALAVVDGALWLWIVAASWLGQQG